MPKRSAGKVHTIKSVQHDPASNQNGSQTVEPTTNEKQTGEKIRKNSHTHHTRNFSGPCNHNNQRILATLCCGVSTSGVGIIYLFWYAQKSIYWNGHSAVLTESDLFKSCSLLLQTYLRVLNRPDLATAVTQLIALLEGAPWASSNAYVSAFKEKAVVVKLDGVNEPTGESRQATIITLFYLIIIYFYSDSETYLTCRTAPWISADQDMHSVTT